VVVARDDFSDASMQVALDWARRYSPSLAAVNRIKRRRVRYAYTELYDAFHIAEQAIIPSDGLTLAAIDETRGLIVPDGTYRYYTSIGQVDYATNYAYYYG